MWVLIGGDSVKRNDRSTCAQGAWLHTIVKNTENTFAVLQPAV